MLDRKSQRFDLQDVWLAEQAIDVKTQRMSGQFAVQPGTQAPKGVGVVRLDGKLPRQLTIHGFDQLAHGIVQVLNSRQDLHFLVRAREGAQPNAVVRPQFRGLRGANVGFVAQDFQIGMVTQQFTARLQIRTIGGGQFKVQDQPTERDEQMQPIAKDGLLFRNRLAIRRLKGFPIATRTRHQVKLQGRDRQTIDQTLSVLAQIQTAHQHLPDQVHRLHQVPPPAVEAALRRKARKQMPVVLPTTQQFCFQMPAATFPNQSHRHQFTISALGFRSGALKERCEWFPDIVHDDKNPSAKIVKVRYHQVVLPVARLSCGDPGLTTVEDFSSITFN
jgi:hypothetical protein